MGSVVISGATSGAITLAVPAEAGTHTVTIPAATGQLLNSGDLSSAGDTSAGDAAAVGYTSAEGLILTGQGSTSDVTIKNDADGTIFYVPTGTNDSYFKGNVHLVPNNGSTSTCSVELGVDRTGNGYSYIDLVGDTTYSDFGLRIIRGNSGANTSSQISHRGTGNFELLCNEAAPMTFGTSGTERMRINSDGRIGMAVTGIANVQLAVKINGQGYFLVCEDAAGTDKVRITSAGSVFNSTGTYGTLSDLKLKENIVDATPKLADLMRVKIRNYNFKNDPDLKQIGMVAQELEEIFPALVEESADILKYDVTDDEGNVTRESAVSETETTKTVKMSVFTPILIKAIQEQQATIEALEARITALEA